MKKITKSGANLRAFLIIVGAMLVAANNDAFLRHFLPPSALSAVGILSVGFITYRAWLDNSASKAAANEFDGRIAQGEMPSPVEVVNTNANPVPTEETKP